MNKPFLKIVVNTSVQSFGKVLSGLLGVFSVLLLTHYLGSEGYGSFTLAFTYVSFFSVLADFGLQTAMVREFSQESQDKKLYGSFLFLKIALTLFSSLGAFVVLFFFPYPHAIKLGIIIATAAVAISGISTYGTVIFQSRLRLDLVTLIDVLTKVFTVGFIILSVNLRLSFYYIVGCVLLGNIVGLLITYLFSKDTFHIHFDFIHMRKILFLSFPIGITAFLGLAYFKIDTIMLSVMRNAQEVGLYSLPYKVLENIMVIWGYYMASAYPLMAKYSGENNTKQVKTILKNSFYAAFLLASPFILVAVLFADFIIKFFGGVSFKASIPSLQILVFALPFLFANNLFSDFFFAQRKNTVALIGIVISLIVNVLLNAIFIPHYGFIGASYITVISAIVFTLYSIILLALSKSSLSLKTAKNA